MDEYIKREDALDAVLFALVGTGHQSRAIEAIRDVSTADVVPKSEVYDDHHKQVTCYTLGCREGDKIKREAAREIFEEIEQQLRGLFDFFRQDDCIRESSAIILAISEIAELKKKYTEGNK